MSDEINLRVYADALRRRWWIVALFVIAALLVAFILSALQPKHYEAVATLTATAPRFQWRFDAGIQPIVDTRRDYQREFLAISKSNDIAVETARLLGPSAELSDMTPEAILAAVSVRTGDSNTLLVTATAGDAQQAAELANAYATAFVALGQTLSGVSADLANYQSELQLAAQDLNQTEQILADTRSATGFLLVSGTDPNTIEIQNLPLRQLDLKSQTLAEYRNDLEGLSYLASQLEAAQPGADLSLLPWERLEGPVLSQRGVVSPSLALSSLDDPQALLATLRGEEAALTAAVNQLAKEADALKRQAADDWRTYSTATRNYGQARDTYGLLTRKVSEAEIQERIDPAQLTLVSAALAPTKSTQTRQLALYAVAGMVGLILGVIVALWSGLRASETRPPRQPALAQ